jgi:hypothetical protein
MAGVGTAVPGRFRSDHRADQRQPPAMWSPATEIEGGLLVVRLDASPRLPQFWEFSENPPWILAVRAL